MDGFRIGQDRRRAEQAESIRAAGCRQIQRARRRADKKIGEAQQRRRFGEAEIADINSGCAAAAGDKLFGTRKVRQAADKEHSAGDTAAQQRNKFRPMSVRPVLIGMRGADAERNPWPGERIEFTGDGRERLVGQPQIRLGRGQRHFRRRHQRGEPTDRLIVEMAMVDAGIGDEEALPPEPEPDALRYAGKFCGERRPRGAVEDPDRAETMAPQQHGEPDQIKATAQLRSGMLEIHRLGDRRLCGKKLPGVACRRRQEGHAAARRDAGDGADKGQVPDDIANAGLHLDHGAACRLASHVACRAKGCDMRF